MKSSEPVDVFIGYSKADTLFLEHLRKQLMAVERVGLVDAWHDGEIEAGSNREESIIKAMNDSEIIILLISADFIASEFNYEKEMKWAMKLHEQKKATVIPVILKDCAWKYAPFAKLNVLPRGGIPVTDDHWKTIDHAFMQVVEEVIKISKKIKGEPVEENTTTPPIEEPTPADNKKPGFFNTKTVLITLVTLIVLIFIGTQVDWNSSAKASPETNLTDKQSTVPITETASTESKTIEKEPLKRQELPKDPPVKKQAEVTKETASKQPESFDQKTNTERINTNNNSTSSEKASDLEILPEPEAPAPQPKKYTINGQTMTDLRDQKTYKLVKINNNQWMAENLKTNVEAAFCPDNCASVGRLYNHKLAKQICPEGWRLPTREEWKALTDSQMASLNLAATLSGTKYRQQYLQAGQMGYYWSSTVAGSDESYAFQISKSGNYAVDRRYSHQAMHCRCVLGD